MPAICYLQGPEGFDHIASTKSVGAPEHRENLQSRAHYARRNEAGNAANEAFKQDMERLTPLYEQLRATYADLPDSLEAYLSERGGNIVRTEALLTLETPAHTLRTEGFRNAPEAADLLAIQNVSGYTEEADLLEDTRKLCTLAAIYGTSWEQVWSDARTNGHTLKDVDTVAEEYCRQWAEHIDRTDTNGFANTNEIVQYAKDHGLLYTEDTAFLTEPTIAEAA